MRLAIARLAAQVDLATVKPGSRRHDKEINARQLYIIEAICQTIDRLAKDSPE